MLTTFEIDPKLYKQLSTWSQKGAKMSQGEQHSCGTGSKKVAKMLFWADSFPEPFYNKAINFIPKNHQTTIPPKYGN